MEISLVLTNDSGSYQTILGQFIETAAASTLEDRVLAQAAADSATASASTAQSAATSASTSASAASTSAAGAASSASDSLTSATNAGTYAAAASTSAATASTQATNAANSATAAGTSATNAANSATAAATSASNAAATLANALVKANNLSDVSNAATARGNLSAAKSGANSDITSLSGLTTALSIAQGGTGGATAAAARTALGAAATSGDLSQFAATTSAQLAGVLSDETGTGSAVFGTGPTISSPVLNGRTSATALASTEIGYRTATVNGGPTGWSNNLWSAIASITLQPGIWDLDGWGLVSGSSTNLSNAAATWQTSSSGAAVANEYWQLAANNLNTAALPMPTKRVQITIATTYYLNLYAGFSTGTATAQGAIWATRRG